MKKLIFILSLFCFSHSGILAQNNNTTPDEDIHLEQRESPIKPKSVVLENISATYNTTCISVHVSGYTGNVLVQIESPSGIESALYYYSMGGTIIKIPINNYSPYIYTLRIVTMREYSGEFCVYE